MSLNASEGSGFGDTPAWVESAAASSARFAVDNSSGLYNDEVERRRRQYGVNRLRVHRPRSDLAILIDQFRSLIMLLLAVAAAVALVFAQWLEAVAVLVVILLNAGIGFITERHARRTMDALFALGTVHTRVRREGAVQIVSAEALVPGDIVLLEAGDVITADLRLLSSSRLQVDESTLTGESVPVEKSVEPVGLDTPLAERRPMLYKGCAVTDGSAEGLVVATGVATELGQINELVVAADDTDTPIEKRLAELGHRLIGVTIVVALSVTVLGTLAGRELILMVKIGLALAVAAIPEGLPVVATIALAGGMRRMAKRQVLIRRLASVETLGSTGLICTDKTGTLTENRMSVQTLLVSTRRQAPVSQSCADDFAYSSPWRDALEVAVLCNNASLTQARDGSRTGIGDPMEVALLECAVSQGIDPEQQRQFMQRLKEYAFNAELRMMATVHTSDRGSRLAVKGAPEAVIACADRVLDESGVRRLEGAERERLLEANADLAAKGLRVLALATRELSEVEEAPYEALIFVALAALRDPPRTDVGPAIAECREAGVDVVMVTGDQAITALAIARDIALVDDTDNTVLAGSEIIPEPDRELRQRLLASHVFARVSPRQKLDLVHLYRQDGRIVAMTGDGVNDAPALKAADIGIAMGRRGTEVAKEASDMVLQNDAFTSIVAAIREGRIIFDNIRTFVVYLMSCNVGEVTIVAIAAAAGGTLPLLPLQILFLNLVTDVFPALALAVGRGSADLMQREPRDPTEPIIGKRWWLICGYGLVFTGAVLGAMAIAEHVLETTAAEATTISFLTLAFAQLWHVFNMRRPGSALLRNAVTSNRRVWQALALCSVLILLSVYLPGLSYALDTQAPDWRGWILVFSASVVPLLAGQCYLYGCSIRRQRR